MKDYPQLGVRQIHEGLRDGDFSARELASAAFDLIDELDPKVHAFLELTPELAYEQADAVDKAIAAREPIGILAGVPIAFKDNMNLEGTHTTCASHMLETYVSPFTATCVAKALDAGGICLGKTNMDEFAFGSSTETSFFGKTCNPWDLERVPGGSSGGSAAAVAAGMATLSLGSDTGGSIRQPGSFTGTVALKPSYGVVSRYGVVAFGSSLDQVGPFARSVEDAAFALNAISGRDPLDCTSQPCDIDYTANLDMGISGMRIGVVPSLLELDGLTTEVKRAFEQSVAKLEGLGAQIVEVELPNAAAAISAYYVLGPCEAFSNLSRFDSVRYGHHAHGKNLEQRYEDSRAQGFGAEAKRRIMLGAWLLASGVYDEYYIPAQKVRTLITADYTKAFEKVDAIVLPTSPRTAFKFGEVSDPASMYLSDIYTISINIAGNGGMSLPVALGEDSKLPIGLQIVGPQFRDEVILRVGAALETLTDIPRIAPLEKGGPLMKELTEVLEDWEAVIGLEVHAELTTLKTKMFCSCPIEFGADPNTHTCPVCLGMPGALPVPNKAAIESIVLAGLATNCDIEKHTMFYRKGYFYPDMAKNFQTTQGPLAFCMRGHLDLELSAKGATERVDVPKDDDGGYTTRIGITRIHMEEDAGKMTHLGGSEGRIDGAERSLVDYNRAGTPLIELVTEPDLRTPEEARAFMQKLRQIYLTLGISDCSMEEGSLRADGNVSLRRRGSTELGTKTELKNINSFKNLHDGLAYEICRQAEVLESGGVIRQETRHWEPGAKRTIVMRVKETADDYRMFPDPDLAPFDLSDEFIENVRAKLPELPDAKKARFMESYGLPAYDAGELAGDVEIAQFFEEAAQDADAIVAKKIANLIINDVSAWANENATSISASKITPAALAALAKMLADDTISSKQGKEVLAALIGEGVDPEEYVKSHGMEQTTDTGAIETIVDELMAANPDKVEAYRGGKTGLQGFFMGQVMKQLGGQGNPKVISAIVTEKLEG